jgi:anaerobic magnesium-protoporphyrin IX monomethyl ester cyclase
MGSVARVALANPPWRSPGHYGVRAGSRWPHFEDNTCAYMPFPFYLAYAGALLEQAGFAVIVLDGCATRESDESFARRLLAFRPDIVVQENATASIKTDLAWAQRIKQATGAFLLMTGHHVPHMRASLDDHPYLDALAGGEWEYTVLETCTRLRDGKPLDGVLGLVHRTAGRVVVEARRPNVAELDGLPLPHRETLDMGLYYDNPGGLPAPSLQLQASRGCPYRCTFCVWPQVVYEDHVYRTRSAANIVDELEWAFRRQRGCAYRSYYFDDDTFNIGDARMNALADEIIRHGLEHIPWGAMCRADTIKRATLENLRRAGLAAVKYGVESGSQAIIDRSGKRLDLGVVRDMVAFTKALGIKIHLTFSFGLVGETQETMRQTLALALELDADTVQFSICTPFPGTEFYAYAESRGLLVTRDFSAYDGSSRGVVRTDALSAAELEDFVQHACEVWRKHEATRAGARRALGERLLRDPIGLAKRALRDPRRALARLKGTLGW